MNKRSKRKTSEKTTFNSFSRLGFSGWAIVFLSVAILTFIGSMIFNQSSAYKSEPPVTPVTIQLLNGCGVTGACEEMADALLPGKDGLLYDIIEKADAEFFGFEKTLVIDRRAETSGELSEKAIAIASRMEIKEKEVLKVALAENLLDIDVTIIAGSDYKDIIKRLELTKEENL